MHPKRVDPETVRLDGVTDSHMTRHSFVVSTVGKNLHQRESSSRERDVVCLPEVAEDPECLSKTEFEKFAFLFLALEYWWLWEKGAASFQCRLEISFTLVVVLSLLLGRMTWDVSFQICSWHGEGNGDEVVE